jgi:hypothetical protein
MTLQREYREGRYLVWREYEVDGETVKSPRLTAQRCVSNLCLGNT